MMAQPFTGERYAGDGTRAWYTGPGGARAIAPAPVGDLPSAALFTTSPHLFSDADWPAYQRVEHAVRLARYGVDCYAYCMVGSGQADIVVEAGLQELRHRRADPDHRGRRRAGYDLGGRIGGFRRADRGQRRPPPA